MSRLWMALFGLWMGTAADPALRLAGKEYNRFFVERPRLIAASSDSGLSPDMRSLAKAALWLDSGRCDSALELYRQVKDIPQVLMLPVQIRMARCEAETGLGAQARARIASLNLPSGFFREAADRVLVDLILRDTTVSWNAKHDSLEARIRKGNISKEYQGWIRLTQGKVSQKSGQPRNALIHYVQAMTLSQEARSEAFDSARVLSATVGPVRPVQWRVEYVLQECQVATPQRCLNSLDSVLRSPGLTREARVRLVRRKAEIHRIQEDLEPAASLYQWLVDSVEVRPDWVQALLRLRRKQGMRAEAQRWEKLFKERFPFSNENANALWVRAFELEQDKKYDSALSVYSLLEDKRFGDHARRQWAPVRKGLIWIKRGEWINAYKALDSAAANAAYAWPQAAALFFQAEAVRMAGMDSLARSKYQETIRAFPLSWYAWRARFALRSYGLLDSAQIAWIQVISMSADSAILWLQERWGRNPKRVYPADLVASVELMLRLGFRAESMNRLEEALNAYAYPMDLLFAAGDMLLRHGEVADSYRLARRFLDGAGRRELGSLPAPVARWLYPKPDSWYEYIREQIGSDTLPPLLVFGVMRQESIFQSDIRSAVGARGLMQIMPQTGMALANKEGIDGFDPEFLYNPRMSMRLGVRYLKDLASEYKDWIYVLAHYNAGPVPARRWRQEHQSYAADLAVEEISYWETRDYVKKVMGNFWTYQAIWGGS